MSKCIIKIKVGEESIELKVDSSKLPNSLSDFKSLFSKEKWEDLVNKIDNTLKNRKKINPPELQKIRETSHLIPNTTIGALMHKIPNPDPNNAELFYPEDTEQYNISDKKVLFLDNYKTEKGELKYGLFKNKNGEEIIIVDRYNLPQVVRYLQTMKAIKADHVLRNISPEIMEDLKLILNNVPGINSVEELLINFLQNKSKYDGLVYEKGEDTISIKAYLNDLCSNIFNISSRKNYKNPTINNINHSVSWNRSFTVASIDINKLFLFLGQELKNKMVENIKEADGDIEKVKELFIKNQISNEESNIIFELNRTQEEFENLQKHSLQDLLEYIIKQEPEFAMKFKEIKNNRIYMEKYFPTLESQYNIGFNELQEYNEPTYYNGKYILQVVKDGISTYYVTKHYSTEKSKRPQKFETLQQAKNYIDNNTEEPIYLNSFIDFHKKIQDSEGNYITDDHNMLSVKTSAQYDKGTLLTLLDYDVPNIPLNLVTPSEAMFISNQRFADEEHPYATKEDFSNFLQEDLAFDEYSNEYIDLMHLINTPEKIAIFVSELNNPKYKNGKAFNRNSAKEIMSLAKKIDKISKDPEKRKYYFVVSSDGKNTKLIPVNNKSVPAYKSNRKTPVIQLWQAASEVLSPKLGIDMEILMEPEKGKEDKKAYIKNNKIYINLQKANPQDLFHEYAHILMAYLKNNPEYRERYLELLTTVWDKGNKLKKEEIENNYVNYSMEDKMEEFFVSEFGNWINNNAYNNYENIFSNNDLIKEGSSIFTSDKSIKELYGSTVEEVLTYFNSDMAQFFKDNKPLMSEEFKKDFTKSRQKTQWIRQQVEEGKLEEYNCYG